VKVRVLFLGVVIALALTASAVGAGSSGFSPASAPRPKDGKSSLVSVSCLTTADCFAVGSVINKNGRSRALIERWRGGRWTIAPAPRVGVDGELLMDVDCPDPTTCLLVGDYVNKSGDIVALVERWNGRKWQQISVPKIKRSAFSSIDCISASDCWATGMKGLGTRGAGAFFAHWNGGSWATFKAPKPSAVVLVGVSCSSPTNCWAGGTRGVSPSYQPWVLNHWDGTSWSEASTPPPRRARTLLSVSCRYESACWAFGTDSRAEPVALRLVGGSWERVPVEVPTFRSKPKGAGVQSEFSGVDCISATDCWAVGAVTVGGQVQKTLAAHWSGGTWALAPSGYAQPISVPKLPPAPRAPQSKLISVDCPSANLCLAVGATRFVEKKHKLVGDRPFAAVANLP
jgi:hypothetical protein